MKRHSLSTRSGSTHVAPPIPLNGGGARGGRSALGACTERRLGTRGPAAGVSRSLYLKELYVVEDSRQQGIGRLMMGELSRVAVEHGCSRAEWTADTDNPVAQRFYAELGVPANDSKIFYRLAGEALNRMGSTSDSPTGTALLRQAHRP